MHITSLEYDDDTWSDSLVYSVWSYELNGTNSVVTFQWWVTNQATAEEALGNTQPFSVSLFNKENVKIPCLDICLLAVVAQKVLQNIIARFNLLIQ